MDGVSKGHRMGEQMSEGWRDVKQKPNFKGEMDYSREEID